MIHTKIIAAVAALAVVAGCTPPSSPNAIPGSQRLSANEAAGYFQQVCLDNANSYQATIAEIASGPYVLNTDVGLYYHQVVDLSFGVQQQAAGRVSCEMRWRGTDSLERNGDVINSVRPGTPVNYNPEFDVFYAGFISAI